MEANFRGLECTGINGAQRGVVLVIALLFLVMLSVIGVSMFGNTTVEEKMARNYRDYDIAFQAAEAALRDAEIRITGYWVYGTNANGTPIPVDPLHYAPDCTNGLCNQGATQPVYNNYSLTASPSVALGTCPGGCDGNGNGTGTGSPLFQSSSSCNTSSCQVASQPRYLIESIKWLPPGDAMVRQNGSSTANRITSLGVGRSSTTQVMLQEVFVPN